MLIRLHPGLDYASPALIVRGYDTDVHVFAGSVVV